jgi:ABC-2 type transport system permease protein
MSSGMSRWRSSVRHAALLIGTTVRASFALRGAFWVSALFMAVNNALFFVTWWILMGRFGRIGGWRLEDVMCLFGISATGFGLAMIFAGGVVDLSKKVHDGELDGWLTQPKSVLVQALGSRTQTSGWGDVASGAALIAMSELLTWQTLPLGLIGVLCAFSTFVAGGVMAHSLAFWLGETHSLSRSIFDFTVTFSVYPPSLFGARLKLLLFTLLPAGFISYLPMELLRAPRPLTLVACVGGSALYAAAAVAVFNRGLRRYSSGSRFGVRA